MKSFKSLIVILSCFISFSSFAQGGGISGGGDSFAAEFVKVGYDIYQILERNPIAEIDSNDFLETVQKVQVNSAYTVYLHGEEVDAINTPSLKHILLNRRRWIDTLSDYKKRIVLVAHEYLGIMRIDDKHYQISHQIFNLYGGGIKGTYTCKIPVLIGNGHLFDELELKLIVYRKDQLEVQTSGKVITKVIPTLATFHFGDFDMDTYEISIDAMITLDLGSQINIIKLPFEILGNRLETGPIKGNLFSYPSKKETEISCDYLKGSANE